MQHTKPDPKLTPSSKLHFFGPADALAAIAPRN